MRYGILRHRQEYDPAWPDSVKEGHAFPETIPFNDIASGTGKGAPTPILPQMWKYIESMNSPEGYRFARSIGMMWINTQYNQDDPADIAKAEKIRVSHNFIRIVGETDSHYQVAVFPHTENLFTHFDPAKHNWYTMPDMFWKGIAAYNGPDRHINVGNNVDVFLPALTRVEADGAVNPAFVAKSRVELLPELPLKVTVNVPVLNARAFPSTHPDVVVKDYFVEGEEAVVFEYKLRGASVWGLTYKGWIALLYSVAPNHRQFFTSWKLDTLGVIPPVPYAEPAPEGSPEPTPPPPPPAFKRRMKYMDVTWVINEAGDTITKRIE